VKGKAEACAGLCIPDRRFDRIFAPKRPRSPALLLVEARRVWHAFAMANAHDFNAKTIDGADKKLSDYKGKTLLIVNVASKCGLTPQYTALEQVYRRYHDRGFEVLGFPCNQFAGQEPGSEADIQSFCSLNYDVSFPLFAKIDVNGAGRHPLYGWLTEQATAPDGAGDVQWNFAKFLVDKNGNVVARFSPTETPASEDLVKAIEAAL